VLNPDYHDMLSAFANAKVEYLIIGAYALAAHGHPRATGDIDLWVRRSSSNAERVMRALSMFGAPLTDVRQEDFERPDVVFQIGVSPRRIDILTTIEGVAFADAWPERMEVQISGLLLPILGRKHLIANKKALGRAQDQADVEALQRSSPSDR
jgi:hypothetical protein